MGVDDLKNKLATQGDVQQSFPRMLKMYQSQITKALPKHLEANADRYTRLALSQYNQNPALSKCTPESIFAAVIIASQLGLELGVLGQGYIVPYGNQAQFIPGWRGIVDLVHRSGRAAIWTGAVFEGDEFAFELGSKPFVKHVPMGEDDPEKLIATYAIGGIKGLDDFRIIECWTNDRVRKHFNKYNKVGQKHYAHKNWEMYARKVVLLQTIKYLPASVEVSTLEELDRSYEMGTPQNLNVASAALGSFLPPTIETQALPEANTSDVITANLVTTKPETTTATTAKSASTKQSEPVKKAIQKEVVVVKPEAKPAVEVNEPVSEPVATTEPLSDNDEPETVQATEEEEEYPGGMGPLKRGIQFPARFARLETELEPSEELKKSCHDKADKIGRGNVDEISKAWFDGTPFESLNRQTMERFDQALQKVLDMSKARNK